jgi:DNA-binding CsgD family transcriptional regulator
MDRRRELTLRQMQIVELVATGLTNRQVAERLNLSQFTVRNALSGIYNRLGNGSRAYLSQMFGRGDLEAATPASREVATSESGWSSPPRR